MKKFLAVALILLVMCLVGCGDEKTAEIPSVLLKNSFWVTDSDNMAYLVDALARDDTEYLEQLIIERKVFQVDRDTKVMRFGVSADKHFALISFKEGRYTNKSGCALKSSVYTEEEYQNYLEEKRKEEERREQENRRREQERKAQEEKERQEKIAQEQAKKDAEKQEALIFIQNHLISNDNYFDLITAGNIGELNSLKVSFTADEKKIIAIKGNTRFDSDVRECAEKAHKILMGRYVVISSYLDSVAHAQKATQNSNNSSAYTTMQMFSMRNVDKYHRETEQLRQEFRNKYGY